MRCAIIKDNKVINIIEASENYIAIRSDDELMYVPCNDNVKIDDLYQDGEFIIYKTEEERITDLENNTVKLLEIIKNLEGEIEMIQSVVTEILLSQGKDDTTNV